MKKVAVIGAGPSGLAVAEQCAKADLSVTMFDSNELAGGVMTHGIPDFRIPRRNVLNHIERVLNAGVEFRPSTHIDKAAFEQILSEYDAVFLGIGTPTPLKLNIEGEDCNGVYTAMDYLAKIESGETIGEGARVLVFGAGNVAMDAARVAVRTDVQEVNIVYRRTQNEMPASKHEIKAALDEGIKITELTAPVRFVTEGGRLTGVVCQKMRLGEEDEKGRRSPIAIENSEHTIQCDMAIAAIGFRAIDDIEDTFKVSTNRGLIEVDERNKTSHDKIYAAGDVVTGAATIAQAVKGAKNAAAAIIERLSEN